MSEGLMFGVAMIWVLARSDPMVGRMSEIGWTIQKLEMGSWEMVKEYCSSIASRRSMSLLLGILTGAWKVTWPVGAPLMMMLMSSEVPTYSMRVVSSMGSEKAPKETVGSFLVRRALVEGSFRLMVV